MQSCYPVTPRSAVQISHLGLPISLQSNRHFLVSLDWMANGTCIPVFLDSRHFFFVTLPPCPFSLPRSPLSQTLSPTRRPPGPRASRERGGGGGGGGGAACGCFHLTHWHIVPFPFIYGFINLKLCLTRFCRFDGRIDITVLMRPQ